MNLTKAYYQLTAYLPRKLPTNEEEYKKLKRVLVLYYGVENKASTWVTVAGQITSTPATKLRKPWGDIANCCKRLTINALAAEARGLAMQEYQAQFEAATLKAADAYQKEETENAQKEEKEQSQSHVVSEQAPSEHASQENDAPIPA